MGKAPPPIGCGASLFTAFGELKPLCRTKGNQGAMLKFERELSATP